MAGFVDVLLRGLILVLASVALGGVAWLRFVLRAEPHVKPDGPTVLALRAVAVADSRSKRTCKCLFHRGPWP